MFQYHMARKVAASTSGMVMPTTRPGRGSMYQRRHQRCSPWRLCRPRLMKLTASTTATASISTLMNSLTELDTALGWSCTLTSCMPAGSSVARRALAACKASPRRMMSPPLVMATPSAIESCPWWRTFTLGGST
ncbi:hypothetical protein D3C85_1595940 [compost metagenome]